jgi:hypothetical protein
LAALGVTRCQRDCLDAVDGSGRCRFVTDGAMRASHRALRSAVSWLPADLPDHSGLRATLVDVRAGVPAERDFALVPTSTVFGRGQRLSTAARV